MGLKYLWDTNAIIYYLQNNFSENAQTSLSKIINTYTPAISVITEIELLCWKGAKEHDLSILKSFIGDCVVFELNDAVKTKTIDIRKTSSIKLPDSIIAATAMVTGLTLITNDNGFNKTTELDVLDPVGSN